MFENELNRLKELSPLVEMTGKSNIKTMAKFLYERISNHDSYLVFLGETSSGKSSIINGLLSKDILPMKASPTTAAITEVELSSEISGEEYYAINKNATIEAIDREMFLQLSEEPDDNLKRLKIIKGTTHKGLSNLRIFDTPGYGSIVESHEEVLKDFLPNSDIIVYTVNYKIGIQDEDYVFLGFLKELIRPDVKIFLLVNRCPVGIDNSSMKVKKISQFVSDILTIDPVVYTISNIEVEEGIGHALPHSEQLWTSVAYELSKPDRIASIKSAFEGYINDLYNQCFKVIEAKYISAEMNAEEFERINRIQQDTASRLEQAIPMFIVPTFDKITQALPNKFNTVVDSVKSRINVEIEKSSTKNMEEMVAYTNTHLLPHIIKSETSDEIQNYVDVELDDLNRKVDDYLQKEMVKFNNDVSVTLQTNLGAATSQIIADMIKNLGLNSLQGYFFAFGGAGGANAGIANAASHVLKKAGDLFGHTFSKATHNGVKHFLAKIGATSMKAVGAVVAVVVELLFLVYQLATWKSNLRKKVSKGMDKWNEETCPDVIKDLEKLKKENIDTIKSIANDVAHTFDMEKPTDIKKCIEEYDYAKNIGKKLGLV